MYTLTVSRGHQTFRFHGNLPELIQKAGEYDKASIVDPDGYEVYALATLSTPQLQEPHRGPNT